jgi:hypothetical protein
MWSRRDPIVVVKTPNESGERHDSNDVNFFIQPSILKHGLENVAKAS